MALSSRLIRRRIRSIANTRKITKAMELVAASKMRKAVNMTLSSRAYTSTAAKIADNVRKLVDLKAHTLLAGNGPANTDLVIVAASDRGLCGGFNVQLLKTTLDFLKTREGRTLRIMTVGKRAESAVRRAGYEIVAAFEAISNAPAFDRARPIGDLAVQEFLEGRVDRVFVVYTHYRSALSQVPNVVQLLPVTPEAELEQVRSEAEEDSEEQREEEEPAAIFEPDAGRVLDELLPRLFDARVYQSLLESAASEHSARMMAMRSATDNATQMLDDLTFTYNQARQASITREISEISAGKAALES